MSSAIQEQLQVWAPSDKDLATLGRQRAGWCTLSRVGHPKMVGNDGGDYTRLTQEELDVIKNVIFRAETLERAEQIRLSLLKLQYDRICSSVKGDGTTSCVVCAKALKATAATSSRMSLVECLDCKKGVCSSCTSLYQEFSGNQVVLCRVCFNKRELWKKSGAWFTNALPAMQILTKDKQQWLAGQLQQQRSPGQPPQPSPGKQHVLTYNQQMQPPSNPRSSLQLSSQPSLNTSTLSIPTALATMKVRSASPFHHSGDKFGDKKLTEQRWSSADHNTETAQTFTDKKVASILKNLENNPPSETDSVITLSASTAAGPEEENSFSFDIYMSVGNTQNS